MSIYKLKALLVAAFCLTITYAANGQANAHFHSPNPPKTMVFAGQTITFDSPDMYERMDRELISFCYMHSNSTLMLKKADRYFSIVEPILARERIPDDFKYLMAIESNLDPSALSSAGAAGLWQMLKATGQKYGLEVNSEVDERYHPQKETKAACAYLREAYNIFGDWITVAASYNAGINGIASRVENQKQSSAFDLWMPSETSRYIFRILAAKIFFENPSLFGFNIDHEDYYPRLNPREVKVDGPISSLVDFAAQNGVSYYAIKSANIWLRSDKLSNTSGKTYIIYIQ